MDVEKMMAAAQQVAEIKRRGQKKATEILNDLMQTAMGFVALYQRKVMNEQGLLPDAKAADIEMFWKAMDSAGVFAKALAPFQDPTFKAVQFIMPPPAIPGDGAKAVEGKVTKIDDPAALGRVYADMVKRVA